MRSHPRGDGTLVRADEGIAAMLSSLVGLGRRVAAAPDLPSLAADAVEELARVLFVPCAMVLSTSVALRGGRHGGADGVAESFDGDVAAARGWPSGASLRLRGTDGVAFVRDDGKVPAFTGPAVPIVAGSRRVAVVAVADGPSRIWTATERDHLEAVAQLVAGAWEMRLMRAEVRRLQSHDMLTGIPNRELAVEMLTDALARCAPGGPRVAVVSLDVDRFKAINEMVGDAYGDGVLVALADRLRAEVREGDFVARSGGDGFVVVCERIADEAEAVRVAERLRRALSSVVMTTGRELPVTLTAGAALSGGPRETATELLRNAETALYRAKEQGRARTEVFAPPLRDRAVRRLGTEVALRRALDLGELVVHYQPVLDLRDRSLVALEALVRWQDPVRGLVPPAEFVPVAEDTGLIIPLGAWVLEDACRQAMVWSATSAGPVQVAVNLSARQIAQSDLVEQVATTLRTTGLEPTQLVLEITETVLMTDAAAAMTVLRGLKDLGVSLSIDDFGTGYSSLSYLKRFPVDTLKIDQSFVDGLGDDPHDSAIVGATIRLADALGLATVAEGVENARQCEELIALGCTQAQGFFLARPAPVPAVSARFGLGPLRIVTATGEERSPRMPLRSAPGA